MTNPLHETDTRTSDLRFLYDAGNAELVRSQRGSEGALTTRSRVGPLADQIGEKISAVLAGLRTTPTEHGPATAALLVRSAQLHRSLMTRLAEIDATLYRSLSLIAREFKRTPRFADGVDFACDRLSGVTGGPVLFSSVGDSEWRIVAKAGTTGSMPGRAIPLVPGSAEYRATDLGRPALALANPHPVVRDLLGGSAYIVTPVSTPHGRAGLIHCVIVDPAGSAADAYLSSLASVVDTAWANDDSESALRAITTVFHNEFCSSTAFSDPDGEAAPESVQLTRRETEVLQLVRRGRSNPEIAEALFLSVETVKSHIKNLLRKHGAANRSELIALAAAATSETLPPRRAVR